MKAAAITIGVNAVALWVAAWIVPGITLGSPTADTTKNVLTIILVAAIFGLINAFVKPLLQIISVPLIVITLGLFLLVVNALMLGLLSWISTGLKLPFHVQHFWWDAIWGGLIVALVGMLLNALMPEKWDVQR